MNNFDLKKYLAESKLLEEEQTYDLTTYNVEYNDGSRGYMYQLTDSEGEMNDIGFEDLYFKGKGDIDDPQVPASELDGVELGSYQSQKYTASEAMKLYRELTKNNLTENESADLIKKAWYDGLHTGRTTSDNTNSTKKWEQFKIENRLNENDLTENKGLDLAKDVISKAREAMKKLTDEEVEAFRKEVANAFDLK